MNIKDSWKLHTGEEALKELPAKVWTVEGLFTSKSLIMVAGDPKSKKTWSMMDMGVCVANGKAWIGFNTTQGNVLFVDEDNGEYRMHERLGGIIRGHPPQSAEGIFWQTMSGINLANDEHVSGLQDVILEHEISLVIIDTLTMVTLGSDLNSALYAAPIANNLRKVVNTTGCSIVLIHHTGKGGGYMGSTALGGSVDLYLEVSSKQDSQFINYEVMLSREKTMNKFSAKFERNDETDQTYLVYAETTEADKKYSAPQRYYLTYLLDRDKAELPQLCQDADEEGTVKGEAVRKVHYLLKDLGLVREVGRGAKNCLVVQLSEAGRKVAEKLG